jgi:hypothetical protein
MANGSFDYKKDPRFRKIQEGAKYGQYDRDTLSKALSGQDLMGSGGYNIHHAGALIADSGFNPNASFADYTKGLAGVMGDDPNARNPGFGGMSFNEFQSLFPTQAVDFTRSDAFKNISVPKTATPSQGNPALVVSPDDSTDEPASTTTATATPTPPPPPTSSGIDPGMNEFYQGELEKARNLARQGRTDFNLQDAAIAAGRMGLPNDIESLRAMVMQDFVAPQGASTGPSAQPQVDVTREQPGITFQGAGPSQAAAQAVGGVTDLELRQQQMDTQRELISSAEEAAARTRQGLPGLKVADPNLNIQIAEAAAPTGGPSIGTGFAAPNMLATGDVEYDPEYFKYETDLQNFMLDALRQNLSGQGGMDAVTSAQMADVAAKQAKDEAQTVEDLQRYGVLRGGGDTADVLGELRSGYGRTYSDILADQATRQQNDPRLEAAMQLAQLGSDRYMRGGEMIGRLGGQDTLAAREAQQGAIERQEGMSLEAQIANQQAIEREADISGFLRGARSLEGRGQDIDAQFGRADRQLEQARVLAPQYQSAADMARSDAMLQQDVADRNLARGLTITEPTTRERFEEGVRGAQQAESLAEAGVTGRFDGQNTLARDQMYEDSRNLSKELANKVRMGTLDAEKAFSLQGLINEGNLDQVKAELASAESMQEADISQEERQSQRDYSNFTKELNNALALANIDLTKSERIQGLINDGNLELAEKELEGLGITVGQEERQSQRDYSLAQKELTNRLTLANIDVTKAERIQTLINNGQLDLAEKELEGLGITTEADKEMQTERLAAASEDLRNELANRVELGTLSMDQATTIQTLINSGNLDLATAELASAEAMQTERVEQEERQSQRDHANFQKELTNRLDLANIDLTKAERIQGLINSGNLEEANAELESAERMQTEALESGERMQTERVLASSEDLRNELANRVALGNITMEQATSVQTLINSGNLDLAQEELLGIKYTTDAEKEMQTERIDMDERQSQRDYANFEKELTNRLDLANIDLTKAERIQGLINSGNLELAQAELDSAEAMQTERIDSEERMQTERIVSQEGQFNSELEFRRAIEVGAIDGMPTLQSQLQKAQLADMLTARQAESLGQLLALANALPDEQRGKAMAAISKPIQQFMEGRGYTDTKAAIANILNVNAEDYGGEAPKPGQPPPVDRVEQKREQLRGIGLTPDEVQMALDGVSVEEIFRLRDR